MRRTLFCLSAVAIAQFSAAHAQNLVADGGFLATPLESCATDLRRLNQISGWQIAWPRQWSAVAADPASAGAALERWRDAPEAIDAGIASLRASTDSPAPAAVVARVLQQSRDLSNALSGDAPDFHIAEPQGDNARAWNAFLRGELAAAVTRYADYIADDYKPGAAPGLNAVDGGGDCYARAITWWTTLTLGADEIEAIGESLLEETRRDLAATAPHADIDALISSLRGLPETIEFSEADLIAMSQAALDRANAALGNAFSQTPAQRVIVEPLPEHVRASAPAGYYEPGDGARPAVYRINPSRPAERRLMAEVIAFHEGAPGHHLSFAYPGRGGGAGFNSGYAEGWALYAEYVADDLGLYSSTLDRQGMMAKHLWAASRLIVEPGLHLHGWSRDDAINYMLGATVMSRAEIEIEVDRYLAMPGQSLSYMLGADFFRRARANAQAALGDAFDIRAFHHVILAGGVRPLTHVERDIAAWVESLR